jgi:DNA-binding MarR family transcriptional regulator
MTTDATIETSACTGTDVEAFRSFMTAHALLVGALERGLARAELPPLVWHDALTALAASPDQRMRIHALADALALSRSGLSRLLDRMEHQDALRRERCPSDRRGAYAVLTDTGAELLERMRPVYRTTVEEHFMPHLGADAEPMREALDRVAGSARAAGVKTDPAFPSPAPAEPSSGPPR